MGRHSKAVKLVGGVRGGLALLDDDERRRAIEAGERDIDDGVGFFAARLGLAERGFEAGRRTGHTGPRATGHRDGPKPGIMRAKRRKPPHYKSGTKNRPYQCARRHVRTTPSFGYAAR